MIDQIEKSYRETLDFEQQQDSESMRCDSHDSNYKISFKSADKFHNFIKLPYKIKNFCLSEKNKNQIFASQPSCKFMFDFNSPKDIKVFRAEKEVLGTNYSDYEVNYNGKNIVVFSGQKTIELFDIRKAN